MYTFFSFFDQIAVKANTLHFILLNSTFAVQKNESILGNNEKAEINSRIIALDIISIPTCGTNILDNIQ